MGVGSVYSFRLLSKRNYQTKKKENKLEQIDSGQFTPKFKWKFSASIYVSLPHRPGAMVTFQANRVERDALFETGANFATPTLFKLSTHETKL